MQRAECTDNTYQRIESSGLANKIKKEVFEDEDYSALGYSDASTASQLVIVGREISGTLELPKRSTFGFRTLDDLHLALGGYCIGEFPSDNYFWRKHGRKTYVSNSWGEGILVTQRQVDVPGIVVPESKNRNLAVGVECWPMFLGVALTYFKMSNPTANAGTLMSRYFHERCEHQKDDEEALVAVKSVKRQGVMIDRIPRLEDSVKAELRGLFAQPLPEAAHQPIETSGIFSEQRTYHPFVAGDRLNLGIQIGREWESEDQTQHSRKVQVKRGQKIIKVRDWIKFSPKDAYHLLRACFEQYCSERAEVPEIVDMFALGRYMEEQTRGLKTLKI